MLPVEVIPGEVGKRHLLRMPVFGLRAGSRGVCVGVTRKKACEHGVHLASFVGRAANDRFTSDGTTFPPSAQASKARRKSTSGPAGQRGRSCVRNTRGSRGEQESRLTCGEQAPVYPLAKGFIGMRCAVIVPFPGESVARSPCVESGRRGSNPRPSAWEPRHLPLNRAASGRCAPVCAPASPSSVRDAGPRHGYAPDVACATPCDPENEAFVRFRSTVLAVRRRVLQSRSG